jgi:lauroyl/myristoyl acyltransferase
LSKDCPQEGAAAFDVSDIFHVLTLLALVPVALFVPQGLWPRICRWYANGASLVRFPKLAATADTLSLIQNVTDRAGRKAGYRACLEMMFEARLQVVDQNLLKRWRPEIEVTGSQYIDAGLDAGNGVILWVCPTAFSDLVVKVGLAQAGYAAAHLSRPQHGFSETVFGMRVLNRLRARVEDRFLGERVPIDNHQEKRAMLSLRRILKKNGVVTITVGARTKDPQMVSLGPGSFPLSAGPARLAELTGAPLIPVFGFRTATTEYSVEIEPPISVDEAGTKLVLQRYADLLGERIEKYPYQCRGLSRFAQ